MSFHPYAHKLIYALDINFSECNDYEKASSEAERQFHNALSALKDTGVTIKGNTVFRFMGSNALTCVAMAGCHIFADYKLFDVQSTINNDASWLRLIPNLAILTVSEDVHPLVFAELGRLLPDTIIAPVNPLTDLSDAEFARRGEISRAHATQIFFERVADLPAGGIICSARDIKKMPSTCRIGRKVITPGIRPSWSVVANDTNAVNAMTHQEAISAGADMLVIGSPLRYNNDLRGNVMRVLDEIGDLMEG